MSVLKTVKCPACGARHLLGRPCDCGGRQRPGPSRWRFAGPLIAFAGTAVGVTAVALAAAESHGIVAGLLIALGARGIMGIFKLGYEWEDGVDLWRGFVLPFPLDWDVWLDRIIVFWTAPRPYFRAIFLGCWIAVIVVALFGGSEG